MKAAFVRFAALLLAAAFIASCLAPAASPGSTIVSSQDLPPIDTSIMPVSASDPDPDASAALDACSITDTIGRFGENGPLGIGYVTGMGKVTPASDAVMYAGLDGAPAIRTSSPAWVITTSGWITLPLGAPMKDPTCVYVDGLAHWYVTGDTRSDDGIIVTPMPIAPRPYRLPPLAP